MASRRRLRVRAISRGARAFAAADGLAGALGGGAEVAAMRRSAREMVLDRYALDGCRSRLLELIDETAGCRRV